MACFYIINIYCISRRNFADCDKEDRVNMMNCWKGGVKLSERDLLMCRKTLGLTFRQPQGVPNATRKIFEFLHICNLFNPTKLTFNFEFNSIQYENYDVWKDFSYPFSHFYRLPISFVTRVYVLISLLAFSN